MKPNIWRLERALTLPPVSTLSSSYRVVVGSAAEEGGLANIFPNIHHAPDTADRRDQQCNAPWYLLGFLMQLCIENQWKKVKEGSQNENIQTKMKFLSEISEIFI